AGGERPVGDPLGPPVPRAADEELPAHARARAAGSGGAVATGAAAVQQGRAGDLHPLSVQFQGAGGGQHVHGPHRSNPSRLTAWPSLRLPSRPSSATSTV